MARLLLELPESLVVAGHHADVYAMPANFDVHIADVRVTLGNVGVPTTD